MAKPPGPCCRDSNSNAAGNGFRVRVSHQGGSGRLLNHLVHRLGKKRPNGGYTHRGSITKRSLASKLVARSLFPWVTRTDGSEQAVHGRAIPTRRIVALSKAFRKAILLDDSILSQNRDNGESHLGIVRVGPGRRGKHVRCNAVLCPIWLVEKLLPKGITDG